MPTLRIPAPLRVYVDNQIEVQLQGSTVGEVLNDLVDCYPGIKPHLFSDNTNLRPFVNLFLGEENIRDIDGLNSVLKQDDRLLLIPSIAGGCNLKREKR